MPDYDFILGDATATGLPDSSVNLVFGSPPYEAQRTYGIGFNLKGQAWVDWMVAVIREGLRVSTGLVAMVVEGHTRDFRYSAAPILLMADLHRAGICLRKPPAYRRVGIPGSGGPDWLRNDYEFVVCATRGGRLPWSDNVAMGAPCRYEIGGEMSYRNADGVRRNKITGNRLRRGKERPKIANPGNIIEEAGDMVHCKVGGGLMGHRLSGENEAPFPETLANFFIRSFCPPDGIVFDPFSGSGTTVAAAYKAGRHALGMDIRQSQIDLGHKRMLDVIGGLAA